jgi:hypothetical protein
MVGDTSFESLSRMVESKQREYREVMRTYLMRRFPELRDGDEGEATALQDGKAWSHSRYA